MLASSPNASIMLGGNEYEYSWLIKIALPGGVLPTATFQASAVKVQPSLTTDQPDGTRLEDGYGSVEADFTIAGQLGTGDATQTAAWLFNPWSTTSPLYRTDVFFAKVTIDFQVWVPGSAGTAPETYRKFTGFVETYDPAPDGTVAFTCFDGRQLLRSLPNIPAVITNPPYNAGLTSEFAVDALLRAATNGAISSWPALRSKCVFAAGRRASVWASVGVLDTTYSQPVPQFTTGVFGTAMLAPLAGNNSASLSSLLYDLPALPKGVGSSLWMEFWTQGIAPGAGSSASTLTYTVGKPTFVPGSISTPTTVSLAGPSVQVTSTGITVSVPLASYTWSTTVSSGPHYIGVQWSFTSSTWQAVITLDGATQSSGAQTLATDTRSTWTSLTPAPSGAASIEADQVTTETAAPSNYGFTPTAIIDPSLNPLQVVPAMSGDPWQVLQQIAYAELAVARFDETTGNFRFQNRRSIAATPVGRTVAAASLVGVGTVELGYAGVVNDASVGYTSYSFALSADGVTPKLTWVYQAPAPVKVPAGGTWTQTVTLDSFGVVGLDTTLSTLPGSGASLTQSYYLASVDKAGTSTFQGSLNFVLSQPASNQITITVTNPGKQDAWLVAGADSAAVASATVNAGAPVLYLSGQVVTQNNEQTVNNQWPPQVLNSAGVVVSGGASTYRLGDVAWDGTGNVWIQDQGAATQLASDVVVANYLVRPSLTNGLSIVPDPRIQLSDKLFIDDTANTGFYDWVQVFGSTIDWSTGTDGTITFTMSIDARVISPIGGGIIGYGSDNVTYAARGSIGVGSAPGSLYIC